MNKDQFEGAAQDVAGKVQQAAGMAAGSTDLRAHGAMREVRGKAQHIYGDAHEFADDVADDLTQETYLRVMSALPRFAGRSSARTWLLSLARRAWVDSVRHDMARPRKSAVEWEDATHASSTGTSWAELVDARVLMEALDPNRREALILTQVLGYTYQEAADIAGVRVGTIRSRVARARQDLVAATEARGDDPADDEDEPSNRHLTAM